MADRICIDTNILIGFLRKDPVVTAWITSREKDCILATTMINSFELYSGAYSSANRSKNLRAVKELLSRVIVLHLTDVASEKAGQYYADLRAKGQSIEFRDILVGAIAASEGFRLKTSNVSHFSRMSGLVLD